MCHYAGFSQIGSQIVYLIFLHWLPFLLSEQVAELWIPYVEKLWSEKMTNLINRKPYACVSQLFLFRISFSYMYSSVTNILPSNMLQISPFTNFILLQIFHVWHHTCLNHDLTKLPLISFSNLNPESIQGFRNILSMKGWLGSSKATFPNERHFSNMTTGLMSDSTLCDVFFLSVSLSNSLP